MKGYFFALLTGIGLLAMLQSETTQAPETLMELKPELRGSINQAVHYLRTVQKNGNWLNHPGVTALCLKSIFECYRQYNENDGPWLRMPLQYILSCQQHDGAFFDPKSRTPVKNYSSALAILALTATKNPEYKERIALAQKFIVEIQCDEGELYEKEKDYAYGGIGYGGDERPDLSNLQLALESLRASGLPEDHPAYKKALIFIERCHDVEGNDMPWAHASGGFTYAPDYPTNARLSVDPSTKEVVPYGSMSFAGLKSLLFCKVSMDDPRVQETLKWLGQHFSVTENPNRGQTSIFYYYHLMSKALQVANIDELELSDGKKVDWRLALAKELLKRQREDGSWVNHDPKYMEGSSELCTAYALNTLNVIYEKL